MSEEEMNIQYNDFITVSTDGVPHETIMNTLKCEFNELIDLLSLGRNKDQIGYKLRIVIEWTKKNPKDEYSLQEKCVITIYGNHFGKEIILQRYTYENTVF